MNSTKKKLERGIWLAKKEIDLWRKFSRKCQKKLNELSGGEK